MQIKKYEAKNMQEALGKIKAELGPEAVILKAKKKKSILGLGGHSGVEITAVASKTSLLKKRYAESKMPKSTIEKLKNSKASIQKEVYDKFSNKKIKDQKQEELPIIKELSRKPIRSTRYIDIDESDEILEDGTVLKSETSKAATNQAMRAYGKKDISKFKKDRNINDEELNSFLDKDHLMKNNSQINSIKNEEKVINNSKDIFDNINLKNNTYASSDQTQANFNNLHWTNEIKQKLLFEEVDNFYADQVIDALVELCNHGEVNINDKDHISKLLIKILSKQIKTENNFLNTSTHEPKLFSFLGDKSSGKTTSIVKIASYFKNKNINLAIICYGEFCDRENYQIDTYSKLSSIDTYKANTLSDLVNILRDLNDLDLILIDTEKTSLYSLDYPISSHLIIDGTRNFDSLKKEFEKYKDFNLKSSIYTKFDLLNSYGNVFNMSVYSKLPISFISLGKNVPEDIMVPRSEEIAEMVLLKIIE